MKIKLSKSQWEEAGKQAGWTKTAGPEEWVSNQPPLGDEDSLPMKARRGDQGNQQDQPAAVPAASDPVVDRKRAEQQREISHFSGYILDQIKKLLDSELPRTEGIVRHRFSRKQLVDSLKSRIMSGQLK